MRDCGAVVEEEAVLRGRCVGWFVGATLRNAVLRDCFVVKLTEGLLCELCGETWVMSLRWDNLYVYITLCEHLFN